MCARRSDNLRIRKRPVRFGNPALCTYHGSVYTADTTPTPLIMDSPMSIMESLESAATTTSLTTATAMVASHPVIEGAIFVDRWVAMVQVPPEQIFEGVLNLVQSFRPMIRHVRIVVEESASAHLQSNDYCDDDDDVEDGKEEKEKEDDASTTWYLILIEMCSDESAHEIVQSLHNKPFTILEPQVTCQLYPVVAWQGGGDDETKVSYLLSPLDSLNINITPPAPLDAVSKQQFIEESKESTRNEQDYKEPYENMHLTLHPTMQLQHQPFFARPRSISSTSIPDHDYNCAVCLEHLYLRGDPSTPGGGGGGGGVDLSKANHEASVDRDSILTTVCNHSFHMKCLLQWQDSPCPVCRYDHSGLNQALSRCHVCGSTDRNFVCLICGVVSCGHTITASAATFFSPGTMSAAAGGNCSICSSSNTNNVASVSSHAQQHYEETLHAYALDTETQHVWDFCGGGYVHRLLQNKDDGKLVEVNHPTNATSQERSLVPGLSEAQEGEVVHRKLEGFASQYYNLLKSQLEEQRMYYESRIQEIQNEYDDEYETSEEMDSTRRPGNGNGGRISGGSSNRIKDVRIPRKNQGKKKKKKQAVDLIMALKHERHQLLQRAATLKSKRDKVNENVQFLKNMNESLEENKNALRAQLHEAQRNRVDMSLVFESMIPPLQQKVTALMLQLEGNPNLPV